MPPARRSSRTVSSTAARGPAQPYTRANPRTSAAASRPSASIARPVNGKTSLRLTVKAPPSKLRQATSGSPVEPIPPNPYADSPSESDATPAPAPRTARSTRNPRTVVEPDSDDEEDAEVEAEDEDLEGEGEGEAEDAGDDDLMGNGNSEEDEDDDAEGEDDDEDMEDHPPPPIIKQDRSNGKTRPSVTVTAPSQGPLKSVEDKEMEDDDDEELSELDSNEGEGEGEGEEDDEDEDSDNSDEDGSRSATPDLSKLTRRQRGAFEENEAGLMALSNEALKKKHLTAEEHAMRRAEMARRRKNLSEKRNEEEKMDTINKLLSKPAPKRRTRAEMLAASMANNGTPGAEFGDEEKPDALYVRWVNNRHGSRIGVPEEWLEGPIGDALRGNGGAGGPTVGGRLVQEVA